MQRNWKKSYKLLLLMSFGGEPPVGSPLARSLRALQDTAVHSTGTPLLMVLQTQPVPSFKHLEDAQSKLSGAVHQSKMT